MQMCAKRHALMTTGRSFPSSSSDKVYKVTAFRPNEFDFCSCPSYIFSRSKEAKKEGVHQNTIPGSCKHLTQTLAEACDWKQERDSDYRFDETCPKCAGPLVNEGEFVVPEDDGAAIDDLRALAASLKGEEAPAPLPKPKPFVVEFTEISTRRVEVMAMDDTEARNTFEAMREDDTYLDQSSEVDGGFGEIIDVKERDLTPPAPKAKPAKRATAKKAAARKSTGRKDVSADVADLVKGAQR